MQAIERFKQKITAAKKALATAGDGIDDIRAAIRGLETERQAVASAPVPFAEAVEVVEQALDRLAAGAQHTNADTILLAAQRGQRAIIDAHTMHSGAVVGFLVQLARPAIQAGLLANLEQDYRELEPGLPRDQRAEKLVQLDAQILELNRQEEGLVAALAESGLTIDRRGSAHPAAVLGLDA